MADRAYGLLGEFADGPSLLHAVQSARHAGFSEVEAFSPHPIPGMEEAIPTGTATISWATAVGVAAGALAGLWLGWYINVVDYPLNVGGRPLASWPAFVLPAFELSVLAATFGGLGAMLWGNGLPRLHHPIFEADGFERVTCDRYFLCLRAGNPGYDRGSALLQELGARRITEVREQWAD